MNIKARVARQVAASAVAARRTPSLQKSFATRARSQASTLPKKKLPSFAVPMDKTKTITAGNEGKLDAGIMTKCSSAVIQMYDHHGKYLGTILTHRGTGPELDYRKDLLAQFRSYPEGSVPKIRAVQTSPDTHITSDTKSASTTPFGSHSCTQQDLLTHLESLGISEADARAVLSTGPGVGPFQATCTATVQKDGEIKIPERLGMFQYVRQLVFGAEKKEEVEQGMEVEKEVENNDERKEN